MEGDVSKFLGEQSCTVVCCQTRQTGIVAVPTPFVRLCQLQSVLRRWCNFCVETAQMAYPVQWGVCLNLFLLKSLSFKARALES